MQEDFINYIIDIYGKISWAVLLKNKKCIAIIDAFQRFYDDFGGKTNKI